MRQNRWVNSFSATVAEDFFPQQGEMGNENRQHAVFLKSPIYSSLITEFGCCLFS
jgi:hypothetical protein